MRTAHTITLTLTSFIIAIAVLLSGSHAKDLATVSLPALWLDAKKQVDDSGQHIVKITTELHSHVDNSGHIADNRSLRLLHENKKESAFRNGISDRLRAWWQLGTLYLS